MATVPESPAIRTYPAHFGDRFYAFVVWFVGAWIAAFVVIVYGVWLLTGMPRTQSNTVVLPEAVVITAVALFVAIWAVRRMGLIVSDDGIRWVRGWGRSRRLPWAGITGFFIERYLVYGRPPQHRRAVTAHLQTGKKVRFGLISCWDSSDPHGMAAVSAACDELNEELRRHNPAAYTSAPAPGRA